MITKIGTATSFADLYYQYMSFLTVGVSGKDKIDPWLIIDPRLNSFYGATLVVPMGDYETFSDEIKIWVDMCESNLTCDNFTQFYDDAYMPNGEYNNLVKTLKHCYPNGIVEEVNNSSTTTAIEDLYTLLQSTASSDLPNIVISCGLFKTLQANGDVWDNYIDIELNNLFTFCANNDIKLYCCTAPCHGEEVTEYDSIYNDIESFISETGERFINLPSKFVDSFGTLANLYSQFPNYGYSFNNQGVLVRRLLQEFMNIDRPEYFVSFQFRNITANSYKDFLYNYNDYQSEEFDKTENGYYDHEREMVVERKIASKDDAKNPFKYNGQIVATGLHTSYDHRLWMCEQGGITCKKEADAQINDIDLLPFWQFWSGSPQKRRDIPVYPSTGCPWMTIASTDISKYGVSGNNPINYYFTKDKDSSTITIRVCDSNFTYPDCWQNIVFGKFTNSKDVIYPLYVGGGSLPLYPDWWLYYSTEHTYGQLYNLSMKNPALANSNILHTTKFGKANLSNFRVMSPDGFWRDIYSAYQTYKDIQYFTLAGAVYEWGECVLPHTYDYTFNTGAELVDTRGKIGLLDIQKDSNNINKAYDKYFEKSNLDELTVVVGDKVVMDTWEEIVYGESVPAHRQRYSSGNEENTDVYISQGTIPRVYASWSKNLEQGLHNSGGRYWLAIPNSWQDRLWHYKFYYGRIYWEHKNQESSSPSERGYENLEYVRDEYHALTEGRYNNKMINDRLVVDFGKAPITVPELEIEFPQDYPTSKDVNLLLRCLVHVESDTIEFSLYPTISNVEVDFGDGNIEQFGYNEQIKHTYSTTDDYYINIYIANASSYYHSLKYYCDTYGTGIVYSDTGRSNVLKKFYLNPYTPDAIFVDDMITSPNGDTVENHGANIIYIYNQESLTELYLPYLAKENHKVSGSVSNNTWFTWFTVIGCNNLSDIYIFNDFVKDYSSVRDCVNSVCLYVTGDSDQHEFNVYVADKYNKICINNINMWNGYSSVMLENSITSASIPFSNINLYTYNKVPVSIGFDLNKDRGYAKSKINLHVPSVLLSEYEDMYDEDNDILSITGDIV